MTETPELTAEVERLCDRFPFEVRTADLGLTRLAAWLAANGETPSPDVLRLVRERWIDDVMRHAAATNPAGVYVHFRPR